MITRITKEEYKKIIQTVNIDEFEVNVFLDDEDVIIEGDFEELCTLMNKSNNVEFIVAKVKSMFSRKQYLRVIRWYPLLEEYNLDVEDFDEVSDTFTSYEEAVKELNKLRTAEDDELDALLDSATAEEHAAYIAEKKQYELNRNAYYAYVNGDRKAFSKMYGDGFFQSFAEWLRDRRASA